MNEYVVYSNIHKDYFSLSVACLDKFENIKFLHKNRNISVGASYSEYCSPCKRAFLGIAYSYIGDTIYTINDKTYHIKEGELIIYGRGCITSQTASAGGSVSYGLAISPQFCKKYGLCDDMICHIKDDTKLKEFFFNILHQYDHDKHSADTATSVLQMLMHINSKYSSFSAKVDDSGTLSDRQMAKVIKYVNRNMFNKIHLEDMAKVVDLHPIYFSRVFKKTCGYSPVTYANFLRCRNARQLLLTTDFTAKEIIEACGFYSMTQFKNMYKKLIGRDALTDAQTPPIVINLK